MASQFNTQPQFQQPLTVGQVTSKDWYFFWLGLFRGLPPSNVEPVTVGASPYIYSAVKKGTLIVTGGTVSAIAFSRDGITFYSLGETTGSFTMNASDQIRITHTGAPTMTFVPT